MIRALKVVLIVVGVVEILLGLSLLVVPDQVADMAGVDEVSGYTAYVMASLGICLIVASVFLIIAARDPLRHINWVEFAIAWFILGAVGGLFSIVRGNVEFGHVGTQIIMDAVFGAALLIVYPYRLAAGKK